MNALPARGPLARARPADPAPPAARSRAFRPEIQGLRAVAVGAVVLYHLGLTTFSGGYVGVDVFFVISGFLITSHLAAHAGSSGGLSLTDFWARRARRLLPASLLVLALCLVLVRTVVPATAWEQSLRQIVASTLYVQNWSLAADAVDYSALGDAPTLVQHYWSLSVEEQFYVLWPVLIVLTLGALRRLRPVVSTRTALAGLVAVLTVVSFTWSVVATEADAGRAYFDTATRIWEFGVGALVALTPLRRLPSLTGWLGLALIAWSATTYDQATAFPGHAALAPVLGAALVIAGGATWPGSSSTRVLSTRPAVFVGDISYAVYLWHWPLIVCWPYVTRSTTGALDQVAIVALTIILAWASTRWFEEPLRTGSWLRERRRVLLASLTAMALVAGAAVSLSRLHQRDLEQARERADSLAQQNAACLGPAALASDANCALGDSLDDVLVSPDVVAAENRTVAFPGCQSGLDERRTATCTLGRRKDPVGTIAVVGDSHSTHWFSALDQWGRDRGWQVRTFTRSSCPFTTTRRTLPQEPPGREVLCREGNDRVLDLLARDTRISVVVTSTFSSAYGWAGPRGESGLDALEVGVSEIRDRLRASGKRLVVIRDVPAVKDGRSAPDCLARTASVSDCSLPRPEALTPDLYARAAERAGVPVVDLTDRFCTDARCPVVVGKVIVFRDHSHLSADYSRLLGRVLGERLTAALRG